jgi:hypothetical protein
MKELSSNNEIKNGWIFENIFYIFLFLSSINLYTLWIFAGYLNIDVFNNISTITNDIPGNVVMENGLIGQHYFGDFLLQYLYADEGSYWINDYIPLNIYPPVSMIIFELFTAIPYRQSFILYLLINLVSIIYPALDIMMNKSKKLGMQFLVITLLSAGTIATLDRGNNIGLLVAPLYIIMKTNKIWIKEILIMFISLIKIYPIIFMMIELKTKRAKNILILVFGGLAINLLVFISQKGSLTENIHTFLKSYAPYDGKKSFLFNSLSLRASIENIINLTSKKLDLRIEKTTEEFFMHNGLYISLLSIGIFILFLIICRSLPVEIKYIFAVYTIWASVPISFIYTTVLLIPVIGFMIKKDFSDYLGSTVFNNKKCSVSYFLLLCSILVTLIPISLSTQDFNVKFLVMNILWLITMLSFMLKHLINQKSLFRL